MCILLSCMSPLDDDELVTVVNTENWFSQILPRAMKLFVEFLLLSFFLGSLTFLLLRFNKRRALEQQITACLSQQSEDRAKIDANEGELLAIKQEALDAKMRVALDEYNQLADRYNTAFDTWNIQVDTFNQDNDVCNAAVEDYNNIVLVESDKLPRMPTAVKKYIRSVSIPE